MHFEIDDVAPVRNPLIEERAIVRLHELVATIESVADPA